MTNPFIILSHIYFIFILLVSNVVSSQSSDDLKFLEMLPDNQASSIYERLGIATGKPISDEVQMEDFDSPSFSSLISKDQASNSKSNKLFHFRRFKNFLIGLI